MSKKSGPPVIKLSSPATKEFWEIPVLHEDAHLLAISKPARLLTSPDRYDPERPNLMRLLHAGVAEGKPWAAQRGLTYLANAHRLDFETTGILLLSKDKPTLVALANLFGSEKPLKTYVALVAGVPPEDEFECDLNLMPDPRVPGRMRWNRHGKKSLTRFRVRERFRGYALLECVPVTGRTHQIRVHLEAVGYPILGDAVYGGGRRLYLSRIKRDYRFREDRDERPLTPTVALHAWRLSLVHPATGVPVDIEAPWPRDFEVALKYLRRYAGGDGGMEAGADGDDAMESGPHE